MRAIDSNHARAALAAAALLAAGVAPLAPVAPLGAQAPSVNAAASGMGENHTAVARGAHAPAWNPANLGLPGNPKFSLVFGGRLDGGFNAIGIEELARYEGEVVPDEVKARWLSAVQREGYFQFGGAGGMTPFAINAGRLALQVGTELAGRGRLSPDAMELLLYGNAGATGDARDLSFAGTDFRTALVSSVALSYAQPFSLRLGPLPDQHFAVGATGRYLVGHGYVAGRDRSGGASADPLAVTVDLPIVQSDSGDGEGGFDAGRGMALDLGASWRGGPWTAAVVLRNVVNTFAWNADSFYWREGRARFDADTSYSDFDDVRPLSTAPASLREELEAEGYARELALGGAWRFSRRLLVTADARRRLGDGTMNTGPEQHVGMGVELRPLGFLPLRAGAARADEVTRLAAGVGLDLPFFSVNASAARRMGDDGSDGVVALTVQIGGR